MLKPINSPCITYPKDQWMPEFGILGKIEGDSSLKNIKKELDWGKPINTEQRLDVKNFSTELEYLKKENRELKNRLSWIEDELSKMHLKGVQNLVFSHDVIDDIWDDEDDSL